MRSITASLTYYADRIRWNDLIPDPEWALDRLALDALALRGIRSALGGGLAFSAYSGRLRNTKDVDLFILPAERRDAIDAVSSVGFEDYYTKVPYDRRWIYRGYRDGVILDLIWQMANYRAEVDERWVTHGSVIDIRGVSVRLAPVEELIWSKLYVVQRERCDWTDLLNLINAQGAALDWSHLIGRVGPDAPVLGAVLQLFGWVYPARARALPASIWPSLGISAPRDDAGSEDDGRRVALLDSRDWFGPNVGDIAA